MLVKVTVEVEILTEVPRVEVNKALQAVQYDTNFYLGNAVGHAIVELLEEQQDINAEFTGFDDVQIQVKAA